MRRARKETRGERLLINEQALRGTLTWVEKRKIFCLPGKKLFFLRMTPKFLVQNTQNRIFFFFLRKWFHPSQIHPWFLYFA